jgi:hypothetical protein
VQSGEMRQGQRGVYVERGSRIGDGRSKGIDNMEEARS